MKKRNLLLLPLFALLIAGCKPSGSSEEPSSTSVPPSTSVPTTSQPPVTTSEPPVTTSEPPVTTSEPVVTSEDEESLPSIPVSEVPPTTVATIAELRAMTDGKTVSESQKETKFEVTGTVTSIERNASIRDVGPGWNFTIQDGNHAIMLYAIPEADFVTNWDDVKVGDLLTATGHLAPHEGIHELGRVKYVSHVAGTPIVPEVLTDISQAALVGKDSKLVTIEGLKLHGVTSLHAYLGANDRSEISVNLDLRKGDVKIGTYMHYNIPMAQAEEAVNKIKTITSNSIVKWTGVLGVSKSVFQLTNARASEWEIVVGDPVVLSGLAFADTTKELNKDDVYSPKLVVTPFDGPLTGLVYASSNETVATVDSEGKVTALAAGTTDITATVGELQAKVVVTVSGEVNTDIVLNVESLGITGVKYDDSNFTGPTAKLLGGVNFGVLGVADNGSGLQWRLSSTSSIWNESTFDKAVASITVNYLETKQYPGKLDLYTSSTEAIGAVQTVSGELVGNGTDLFAAVMEFAAEDDIRFFRLQYPVSGHTFTNYVSSITVTFHADVEVPVEPAMDLFISEWIEPSKGNGNNKFIEIYNPLAEAVDLSTYTMKAFPNGADTASATLALTGTLAAGETIVIYNVEQTIITTEIPSTWISQSYPGLTDFNGDDTFGLFKNDVLIDLVGEIGVDPGTEWSGLDFLGASVQTKDSNWTRHGSITVPNATFTMAEWVATAYTAENHTLGSHTVAVA